MHGLIAATADQTPSDWGIDWATGLHIYQNVPGGTGTALGTGAPNTDKIIAQNGAGSAYAAGLARAYSGGGYSDWYLPSKDELNELYLSREAIGGFHTYRADRPWYWSSSEGMDVSYYAWSQRFDSGQQIPNDSKYFTNRVRAVRSF